MRKHVQDIGESSGPVVDPCDPLRDSMQTLLRRPQSDSESTIEDAPQIAYVVTGYRIMSQNSAIEWTDTTWNPVTGCTKISAGCDNCYAARFSERFRGVPGHPFETGFDLSLRPERLLQPFGWKLSVIECFETDGGVNYRSFRLI
jgi:Protein of unknown function (DUF5131)